ncbi:MAG: RNA polymerase sigma factor (TIGR02999 family) [Planctomycetota bacterium]
MSNPPRDLVDEVYGELRRLAAQHMAREAPGMTLQPTALVHEVYLRLSAERSSPWQDRGRLFGAAALAMRRILVDEARRRKAVRRGGHSQRQQIETDFIGDAVDIDRVLDIDSALTDFEAIDARAARIVQMRYFGGLTVEETAAALDIAPRTVRREWALARLWLYERISMDGPGEHNEV